MTDQPAPYEPTLVTDPFPDAGLELIPVDDCYTDADPYATVRDHVVKELVAAAQQFSHGTTRARLTLGPGVSMVFTLTGPQGFVTHVERSGTPVGDLPEINPEGATHG